MGKFVLAAAAIALLVYSVFDLLATPKSRVRGLPKPLWFIVILVPLVGPLAWLFLGHPRNWRPSTGGRPKRPPFRPKGPDDDPDYLGGL